VNNNEDVDIEEQIGSEFRYGIVYTCIGTIRASRQVKFCDVDNFKKVRVCVYIYIYR